MQLHLSQVLILSRPLWSQSREATVLKFCLHLGDRGLLAFKIWGISSIKQLGFFISLMCMPWEYFCLRYLQPIYFYLLHIIKFLSLRHAAELLLFLTYSQLITMKTRTYWTLAQMHWMITTRLGEWIHLLQNDIPNGCVTVPTRIFSLSLYKTKCIASRPQRAPARVFQYNIWCNTKFAIHLSQ